MENNIKVSPSHELLEELKTAVFNYDFLAITDFILGGGYAERSKGRME